MEGVSLEAFNSLDVRDLCFVQQSWRNYNKVRRYVEGLRLATFDCLAQLDIPLVLCLVPDHAMTARLKQCSIMELILGAYALDVPNQRISIMYLKESNPMPGLIVCQRAGINNGTVCHSLSNLYARCIPTLGHVTHFLQEWEVDVGLHIALEAWITVPIYDHSQHSTRMNSSSDCTHTWRRKF